MMTGKRQTHKENRDRHTAAGRSLASSMMTTTTDSNNGVCSYCCYCCHRYNHSYSYHIIVVTDISAVVVVLLLFGGKKIPELMRGLGSGIKEFKDATKEDEQLDEGKKESSSND